MTWERLPGQTFFGSDLLRLGVYDAVAHFNIGCEASVQVLKNIGINPGKYCEAECSRKKKRKMSTQDFLFVDQGELREIGDLVKTDGLLFSSDVGIVSFGNTWNKIINAISNITTTHAVIFGFACLLGAKILSIKLNDDKKISNRIKLGKSEQQFKRIRITNFLGYHAEVVKENLLLKKKYEKLEKKFKNLAETNAIKCHQIEELKRTLESSENNTNVNGKAIQVPHELDGFVNPCNCSVSCVYAVGFFIFHYMEFKACNVRFIVKVAGKDCRYAMNDFFKADLIERDPVFSKKITGKRTVNHVVKDAVKAIENQSHPAFLLLEYEDDKCGHCVALMPYGFCIDVSKRQYWKPEEGKRVVEITVVNLKRNAIKDWEEKFGPQKCEDQTLVDNFGESSKDA